MKVRTDMLAMMLVIPLLSCSVFAGPWPRKQGEGFVQLGFSTISYNEVYDDHGDKNPLRSDLSDIVVQVFANYGIDDHVTLSLSAPFKFLSATPRPLARIPESPPPPDGTNSGIGDIDIAMQYNWLSRNGYALSTEIQLGLPTGEKNDPNGLVLGDGESNVAARILGGKSFYPSPLYVSVDVAYNFRSKGFPDDVFYNAEIGYGFLENRLVVMVLLSGRESTSTEPTPTMDPSSTLGLLTFNQEFTAIIPKILYKFDERWGISASYATALHGRNVAGGSVLAGGVFYEF
jgi:hypothetical protein